MHMLGLLLAVQLFGGQARYNAGDVVTSSQ